ncbi:MAG TPA: hypothetical protein VNL77_22415 [Roseiflexaceae bacterium]|nr:hypothetical protein [Roseiflexaceae bacterium]
MYAARCDEVWTKSAAIARLQENRLVQEAIAADADVRRLFDTLVAFQPEHGYVQAAMYATFRNQAATLVGWGARCEALQTTRHYEAVCETILDLLPPDVPSWCARWDESRDVAEVYPQLADALHRVLGRDPTEAARLELAAALEALAREQRDLASAARDHAVRQWHAARA